jgi:hypothetical protein
MSTQIEKLDAQEGQNDAAEILMRAAGRQTPWWVVSIAAHGLIIAITGLLTLVIEVPDDERAFVPMVTDFSKRDEAKLNAPALVSEVTTRGVVPIDTVERADLIELAANDDTVVIENLSGASEIVEQGTSTLADIAGVDLAATNVIGALDDTIGLTGPAATLNSFESHGEKRGTLGLVGEMTGPFASRSQMIIRRISCCCGRRYVAKPALRWLAEKQEVDGHWDSIKHGAAKKNDTAVTGLALLTFLGAGETEKRGEFSGAVRKAVAWLKSQQAADGSIWNLGDDAATHRKLGYPHAIAAAALAEASGMAHVPDTHAAAQKAIDYCTQVQQSGEGFDKGGWRYTPGSAGDLSVTGWYVMALKSAKMSGLRVPAAAINGALTFLDSVEVKTTDSFGQSVSHYKYTPTEEHPATSHRLTAIGTLARQFLGAKKEDLQSTVEAFVALGGVPSIAADGSGVDLYYWYYGSLCAYQQGGSVWMKWNDGMMKSLVHSQITEGPNAGSWKPAGDFSDEWGRVGQTAMSAMCMEVYFRYQLTK